MKKVLAILLAMVMVLSMLPLTAFAATTVVTYEKVTTAPEDWSGTYVIVYEEGNKIFNGSLNKLDAASNYVDVNIDDSVVTTANLTGYEFTIAAMDGGYSIQAASGKFIGHSSNANKLTSSDTALVNDLSMNDDGSVNIICAGGAYLRYNATSGQDRFRYFKSSSYTNQKAICLYAKVETEVSCNHEGTTTTVQGAKDATCTVDGYTGDTVCECGATIEYGSAITAPGHTESSVVTAATCTTDGYTTYTCSVCGNVRTDDTVAATGHTLVDGVCSVCGVKQSSVQKASAIAVGDKVIIVCESKQVELSSFNGTSYANGTAYTDAPMGLYIWTIATGASDGTYAFVDSEGAYLAWSSSNSAKTSDTLDANSSWTVSFDEEGNALIANAADATRLLKWNASSPRFACYTSAQTAIQIYIVASEGGEGGSEPEPEVTEPEVTEPSAPATCPDENHNFVDGKCTICGETEPIGPIDPSDPILPENSATYIFSDYNQEAAIEAATTYKLDDTVSITLSKGWLTSELRVYKGANVVFTSTKPIAQIDFNGGNKGGNADIYVTTDGTTWKLLTEIAYVAAYTDYSVKLPSNVIGVKIEVLDNQIRIKNATLTFGEFVECSHANATEIPAKDATCTESGNKAGMYCAECDTYFGGYEVIPATGHSYAYVDGTVSCSACGDAVALSTIAEAKAFTDKNQVYFVKGIVTYITGNSVYIEDATGAILVYFDKNADISTIALGDELAVWDTLTVYNGAVIETTYTLASESVVVSSGNTVPMKELTIAELLAATESKYLSEKITLKGVTVTASDYNADYGNVTYTLSDSEGNSIVVYRAPAASAEECFQVGDKVDVEAVVAAYVNGSTEGNGYQLTTDHTLITLAKEEPTGPEVDENLKFYRSNTSGGDLMLGDDIRASFMLKAVSGYDRIYLEITKDGVTTIVDKNELSNSTYFRYAYVVPAAHMTMDINVTIWGEKEGKTYRGEELVFSIRRCAEAKLASWINNPAAAGQCKLIMNMLYYGEKAQIQFGVNTDNLATTGLDQKYLDLITTEVPSLKAYPAVDETGKIAKISNMGFMLQEKVKLTTIFKLETAVTNAEEYYIEVKHIPSKAGVDPVTYTYTSENFELLGSNKMIRFFFDKIAPSQMRDDVEYTLYHNGEAISTTYVRSMETVAQYYATNAPALTDLIHAVMNYADAAKAVFG